MDLIQVELTPEERDYAVEVFQKEEERCQENVRRLWGDAQVKCYRNIEMSGSILRKLKSGEVINK